jgi:hypothetical protein
MDGQDRLQRYGERTERPDSLDRYVLVKNTTLTLSALLMLL